MPAPNIPATTMSRRNPKIRDVSVAMPTMPAARATRAFSEPSSSDIFKIPRAFRVKRLHLPLPGGKSSKRAATSFAFAPSTATVFVLDACPPIIVTRPFLIPRKSATILTHSSFAFPSTGGAAILSLSAPSWKPANSEREALGTTRIVKRTALSFSRICTIYYAATGSNSIAETNFLPESSEEKQSKAG
jgi:hypothetical protein